MRSRSTGIWPGDCTSLWALPKAPNHSKDQTVPAHITPDLCLSRLLSDYQRGTRTPTSVVTDVLRAARDHKDNPIWIHLIDESDLMARACELEAMPQDDLPLYGVPFAVKDNIDVARLPTTAACPAFEYIPDSSAPVVEHLIKAGAILIGKTNLDQFATGLVGVRSPWGACQNAFDKNYVSGGSSSGSAVAVALGLVSFALGTDTAGSGRVPAGFNNLIGLKPTLGRISTRGVVPACQTLDCVSIFALTASDAKAVLDIAGVQDPDHPWSREVLDNPAIPAQNFTFAVPAPDDLEFFGNDDYAAEFEVACARMESIGGQRRTFDYTAFAETAALLYGGPWVAERFHAARSIAETQPESLLPVIRSILEGAKNFDAVDTFDAQYRLEELRHQCADFWDDFDLMVLPTAPTHPTIAAVEAEPVKRNSELGTYTNFVNFLDLCAVSVPAAMTGTPRLPFGVTMIGPAGDDTALLELADRFHRDAGLALGASGHKPPAGVEVPSPETNTIRIAVCGAHLSGQSLNHQLTDRGGRLVAETTSAAAYRFYALAGGPPARPGMIRVDDGAAIGVEVWELPAETVGSFVAGIPAPLGVGRLELADGTDVMGFLCEPYAISDAVDITEFGDWRSYLQETNA